MTDSWIGAGQLAAVSVIFTVKSLHISLLFRPSHRVIIIVSAFIRILVKYIYIIDSHHYNHYINHDPNEDEDLGYNPSEDKVMMQILVHW